MVSEPVGVIEIAEMLGVKVATVHQWLFRAVLPAAQWESVNGSRAWERKVILEWAGRNGRIGVGTLPPEETEALRAEFRRLFKEDPAPPQRGGRPPRAAGPAESRRSRSTG